MIRKRENLDRYEREMLGEECKVRLSVFKKKPRLDVFWVRVASEFVFWRGEEDE